MPQSCSWLDFALLIVVLLLAEENRDDTPACGSADASHGHAAASFGEASYLNCVASYLRCWINSFCNCDVLLHRIKLCQRVWHEVEGSGLSVPGFHV